MTHRSIHIIPINILIVFLSDNHTVEKGNIILNWNTKKIIDYVDLIVSNKLLCLIALILS